MADNKFIMPSLEVEEKPEQDSFIMPSLDADVAELTPIEKARRTDIATPSRVTLKPFGLIDDAAPDTQKLLTDSLDSNEMADTIMSAVQNKYALGIEMESTFAHKKAIDTEILNRTEAMTAKEESKRFTNAVSTIGAAWQYQDHSEGAVGFSAEETLKWARYYRKHDMITEHDLETFEKDPKPLYTWQNPAPMHFYDKTFAERVKEAPQSIAGGVNQAVSGWFRGIQWLEGEANINIGAKGVADWFDENAQVATEGVRRDFFTDTWGGVGSAMTLVAPGLAGGKVLNFTGLPQRVAMTLEISGVTANEALMIAGSDYQEVLTKTGDIEEAQKTARISFGLNLPALLVTNVLGIYSGRIKAIKQGPDGFVGNIFESAKTAGRGFAGEFVQEGPVQASISQFAKGEKFNLGDVLYEGFIGGLIGGPTAVLLERAEQRIDAIPELSPGLRQQYANDVKSSLAEGDHMEEAHVKATQNLGQADEGLTFIGAMVSAQEAAMQADASFGADLTMEDVTTTPPLEADIAAEVDTQVQDIFDTELSDDQIIDQILTVSEQGQEAAPTEPIAGEVETAPTTAALPKLGEKGFIDLNSEVSLKPILDDIKSVLSNTDQLAIKVKDVGLNIWREGKVKLEDFTTRMKEVMGDLWESVKGIAKTVWNDINNERGAIDLPEFGKRKKPEQPTPKLNPKAETFAQADIEPSGKFEQETFHDRKMWGTDKPTGLNSLRNVIGKGFATRKIYRGMTTGQIKEGAIPVDERTEHDGIKSVLFTTSPSEAMDYARRSADFDKTDAIILEMDATQLPDNFYMQNNSREAGAWDLLAFGFPENVDTSQGTITPLTEFENSAIIEDERRGYVNPVDIREESDITEAEAEQARTDIAEGVVLRPKGIEDAPDIERVERGREEVSPLERGEERGRREDQPPELDPQGKPKFDPANILHDLEGRLSAIGVTRAKGERGAELPAFFFNEKGEQIYSEQNAKAALDKVREGRELDPEQHQLILDALAEGSAEFMQEAIEQNKAAAEKVDTADADFFERVGREVEEFAEGELDAIVERGMDAFVKTLKVKQVKTVTKKQAKIKEAKGQARQLTKQVAQLTEALKDKIDLINLNWQDVQDQKALRKVEGKESKAEIKKLESKIATRDKQIVKLRDKTRTAAKNVAKDTVKGLIRRETGQRRPDVPLIREDVAFREVLKAQVKAARSATGVARKAAIAEIKATVREKITQARAESRKRAEVKKVQDRLKKLNKSKMQNISVDYQKKINDLIATIDLKGRPTERTLNQLVSLKEWFETHQDKLSVPQERIDKLDRLGKLSLQEMTIEDVREIDETIKTLVSLGKLKRRLKLKYQTELMQEARKKFAEAVTNIDAATLPEDASNTQKTANALNNAAKQFYVVTLHAPRVADMMDGFMGYDGLHASVIKDMVLREQNANVTTNALMDDAIERIQALGFEELSEEQQLRLMINIRLQESALDQVDTLLEAYGLKGVPELKKNEQELINIIQDNTTKFTDEIAALVEEIDNQIFERNENYILPLKYQQVRPESTEQTPTQLVEQARVEITPEGTVSRQGTGRTTKAIQGFKIKRNKGVKRVPRIDILGVLSEAINEQQWYLNLQPILEESRQIFMSDEYMESAGEINSKWWVNQMDIVARQGWRARPNGTEFIEKGLKTVRVNLSKAVMGYKLSSAMMQPFAVADGMAFLSLKFGPIVAAEVMTEVIASFAIPGRSKGIVDDSIALQLRTLGDVAAKEALESAKGNKFIDKFVRASFKVLQWGDIKTAAGVRNAAVKVLKRNGIENAENEADFIMNLASSSADVTMRPQALAAGEGMRTLFAFQSFALNRWGILMHDIVAGSIKHGDIKTKAFGIIALSILMASDYGEDEAREVLFEITTGRDLNKNGDMAAVMIDLMLMVPYSAPLVGSMLEEAMGGFPSGSPLAKTVSKGVSGVVDVGKGIAKGEGAKVGKGVFKTSEAGLTLFGVPGTAQFFDLVERLIKDKKKRKR